MIGALDACARAVRIHCVGGFIVLTVHVDAAHAVLLIAAVLAAMLDSHEQPSHAATKGLDDVPQIQCVPKGLDAEFAARRWDMDIFLAACHTRVRRRVIDDGRILSVRFPRIREDMEDREEEHFEAEQHCGDAGRDVGVLQLGRGREDVELRCRQRNGRRLPEAKKDDALDGKHLEEGLVISKLSLQLDVELDDAVHGNRDCHTVDDQTLARTRELSATVH